MKDNMVFTGFERYVIDWDKVQTLDDMKRLLAAFNVWFTPNNPNLKNIEDLVRVEKVE